MTLMSSFNQVNLERGWNWYSNQELTSLNITKYNKTIAEVFYVQQPGQELYYHNTSFHQAFKQITLESGGLCLIKTKKPFSLPKSSNNSVNTEEIKIRCNSSTGKTIIRYPFKLSTNSGVYENIIKIEQINKDYTGLIETSTLRYNSFYLISFTETFDIINPKFLALDAKQKKPTVVSAYEFISRGPNVFPAQNIGIVGFLDDVFSFNNCVLLKTSTPSQMRIYVQNQFRMCVSFYSDRLGTNFSYFAPSISDKIYTGKFVEGNVHF